MRILAAAVFEDGYLRTIKGFDDGVLYGLDILVLEFLAWRFMRRRDARARIALRVLAFGLYFVCVAQ
ncbi:hypothetical protein [Paraburkholderia rhynchosiae]|uniref:Uncharacterized protein n=1 Tax=Paraburkholderia rhynchosiae TaxID=487049 RepID=A0ABX4V2B4_9BURK|nr:hypothetical protein [Paraburkholderia rhynchosiae]PMS29302.1 hypothetical protein C0Z16_19240 [Paraburkholderia rhynchosiae]